MEVRHNLFQTSLRSAGLTALFLFGGLLLGFLAAFGLTGLPMHLPESARVLVVLRASWLSFLPGALCGGGASLACATWMSPGVPSGQGL